MGLSRKLGATGPKPSEHESNAVPYKWSTQTYTMMELLSKFKLPCVVQCATDPCSVVWSDFQFDLRQPLLLFERRTVQKVHGISVSVPKKIRGSDDSTAQLLEEVGPPMAIPCDYEGWFGAAPKGQEKVKRHTRVEGVANSTARRFLVTTKLPAFTSSRSTGEGGTLDGYVPHDVMPGEVLKRVCVLDPNPGDPDCPTIVRMNGPCLECLDEKDEGILIPLSRRAMLYEIAEVYPDEVERVFTMAQVVAAGNAMLPRVLKLAHGDPPLLAYAFTGMVRCYSVFTEETILAATLDDMSSICLELATDSCARFRLGLNGAAVKKTCEYGNAVHMRETIGTKFLTGIKVSFSLQPEFSDLEDIDLSFYESQNSYSDMQEVEANSEFEISWGAVKKAKLLSSTSESGQENGNDVKDDSSDNDNDDLFLEGLPETKSSKEDNEKAADEKSCGAMPCSKTSVQNSELNGSLPRPKEFTEKEVADLMQRKGMIATAVGLNENQHFENPLYSFTENRVKSNPLFYYFQRESGDKGDSLESFTKILESEGSESENASLRKGNREDTSHTMPDILTAPVENAKRDEVRDGIEDAELDSSVYEQIICTPAREYSEDEVGGSDSSSDNDDCNDDNNDVIRQKKMSEILKRSRSSEEAKRHFPIEANVVVKSMGKRATRSCSDMSIHEEVRTVFRGNNIDTSSSDDVTSDLERVDEKFFNKNNQDLKLLLPVGDNPFDSSSPYGQHLHETQNPQMKFTTTNMQTHSYLLDVSNHLGDSISEKKVAYSGNSSFKSLAASAPKPTFTEVDDPLESTMSELDKITSIKPAAFVSEKFTDSQRLHNSSVTNDERDDRDIPSETKSLSTQDCSKSLEASKVLNSANRRPDPVGVSTRPLAPKVISLKHADVMQEEDRFNSPRVSHHPHVHPHTSALHPRPDGTLHLGQWTKPVPLGGSVSDSHSGHTGSHTAPWKFKVLNSVKNFERLNSTSSKFDGSTNVKNTFTLPTNSELVSGSVLKCQDSKTSTGNKENNPSVSQNIESNVAQKTDLVNTDRDSAGATDKRVSLSETCVKLDASNVYSPVPDLVVASETESEEDVVTIEEHYVISANSRKSPGTDLKVLPVYQEDLKSENFV
ncbi:hypothetical protein PoB_000112200 [Plakobranchus ocellatus]|uniref:CABIT domain-containing protein n=1 Tax=Plakobranchus ocellatus TaxID=259542 RepID=A0AAV3XXP6_9GAST|nr:hypothetical protein PoB_000112200 [Plakobranchus ocellatus]